MAWISIENLGLYHKYLKDWIADNIHANKVIQDKNNKFVSNDQMDSWNAKLRMVAQFEMELPRNRKTIPINKEYQITDETVIWLFIDGIKQIKGKHFKIDKNKNSLILTEPHKMVTNVEVIIFE